MRTFCLATVLTLTSLAPVCSKAAAADGLVPTGLRVEYRVNPLGIDVTRPRLSWVLRTRANAARRRRPIRCSSPAAPRS